MATKPKSSAKKAAANGKQQTRVWLMYPPKLIKEPLIWQLAQKFPVVTNIRQCSVTDEIGIVSLELDGQRADIKAAIKWLEKIGVSVEPVDRPTEFFMKNSAKFFVKKITA
jgi:ABC-type methionine transport system ATPase subunit